MVFRLILFLGVASISVALFALPRSDLAVTFAAGTVTFAVWVFIVIPIMEIGRAKEAGLEEYFFGARAQIVALGCLLVGASISVAAYFSSSMPLTAAGTSLFLCGPLILASAYRKPDERPVVDLACHGLDQKKPMNLGEHAVRRSTAWRH
ncbi:hypothetical protein AB4Z46_21665 [Variovorax sp. M-6]